jgi:hypothetical protein
MLSGGFSSRSAYDRHHGHGSVSCGPPHPYGIDHGIPLLPRPSLHCIQFKIAWYSPARSDRPQQGPYLQDKTPSLCLSENNNSSDTIWLVGRWRCEEAQVLVHGDLSDSPFHPLCLSLPDVAEPSLSSELPTSPPLSSMAAYNCMCLLSPEVVVPTQGGPSGDVNRWLACRLGARMSGGNLCAVCCPPAHTLRLPAR